MRSGTVTPYIRGSPNLVPGPAAAAPLGTCEKHTFSDPTPQLWNQKLFHIILMRVKVWQPLFYIISVFSSYLHPQFLRLIQTQTVTLPFDPWLTLALGQPDILSFSFEDRRASDFPQSFPHKHPSFISLHGGSNFWKESREMRRRPFSKWGEGIKANMVLNLHQISKEPVNFTGSDFCG